VLCSSDAGWVGTVAPRGATAESPARAASVPGLRSAAGGRRVDALTRCVGRRRQTMAAKRKKKRKKATRKKARKK
jgi:hypothetical protein